MCNSWHLFWGVCLTAMACGHSQTTVVTGCYTLPRHKLAFFKCLKSRDHRGQYNIFAKNRKDQFITGLGIFMKSPLTLFLLLIFSLSVPSCSSQHGPEIDTSDISIIPDTLDFGRVRQSDSPIRLPLLIKNNSHVFLTISGITSGCGCTVVDIPLEPVSPGTSVSGVVMVDLHGRNGVFTNKIAVTFLNHPPVLVDVCGKIVNDFWLNENSIYATSMPGQKEISTTFSLYTVDYPDISIKLDETIENFSIHEQSRVRQGEEIKITFLLRAQVDDSNYISDTLKLCTDDPNIPAITIPFYCYREVSETQPRLDTIAISLGIIKINDQRIFYIHGDQNILSAICEVKLKNTTGGIILKLTNNEEIDKHINGLPVLLQTDSSAPTGTFEGEVCFTTHENHVYTIPFNCEIR